MRALATWCVRHRRVVVVFWLGVLIAVTLISRGVGSNYSNSFSLPRTQSTEALDLLEASSPKVSGDVETVVFATSDGARITDPAIKARINAALSKELTVPHVSGRGAIGALRVSPDGTVAFATVTFDEQTQNLSVPIAKEMVKAAETADAPNLHVSVAGQLAEETNKVALGGTLPGVVLAAVVLLLVFGSLYAMALPIISALASLGTAVGLVSLLSHVLKMPAFSTELVLLIGLGVGVDYALFIVTRHRQGLVAGMDVEESIVNSVNTSGRAVLFAGIIVCIALLGMFALGVSFLYGLAVAAALGVALTMIAALTLLPALLGFIGARVLSRSQKSELRTNGPRIIGVGTRGFWTRWANLVQRRPGVPAVVALVLIVTIALPFFSLRLGSSDQGNDAKGTTTRTAYDTLAKGFGPGFNGPLQLVAQINNASEQDALNGLVTVVGRQAGVASVAAPVELPAAHGTKLALVNVYPTTSPQAAATTSLISRLRKEVIPGAVSGSGLVVYVGGNTAIFVDFAHVLSQKLPLFIGLVVVLAFILLAMVFRSLVIPLTAACMNLLSIGAAFGILVAVFQWGWLGAVFGVNRAGPIQAFLPVMLFAILFGLSMDYQVFLVTRIHEEYLRSGDSRVAVRNGLASTGKTISAAALIMILVFGSFILGGQLVIKQFGLGLAGGILVDALVIRMAVVPSLMFFLGKANWWFPKSLDRVLPQIGVEAPSGAPPASEPGGPPARVKV